MAIHKGTGLNNVKETWRQNEERDRGAAPDLQKISDDSAAPDDALQQTIRKEAAEYDRSNNEDRLLGGQRATLNDDDDHGR